MTFLILLTSTVTYGWVVHGDLAEISPSFEHHLVTLQFARYDEFLTVSSGVLVVYLGLMSAATGKWQNRLWVGLVALLAGAVLGALGYALLPHLYFPGGDFSPWLIWLSTAVYSAVGFWVLATLLLSRF